MYLLIGADIVPTDSNVELFKTGNRRKLVGEEIEKILANASYRIFNLEIPLTDKEEPILKQGPNLIAPTESIEGYKALEVDILTLANNHILDQGEQALRSTIDVLDKAGIAHLGAGDNLRAASEPYIFEFCGKQIGIYACAEHEFSIATEKTGGANPFDPLWSLDHIEALKLRADYVIVLYHGGKEHYRYPSPNLQKICRRMVDKGADLVICQHSHCIGCEEKYKGGIIVYGQGNFLFDDSDNECWQTGLLVKIDEGMCVSYIPLVKDRNSVRLANEDQGKDIIRAFRSRSEEIKTSNFVQESYDKFSESFLPFYLAKLKGKESFVYKVINKLSGNKLREKSIRNKYDAKLLTALWNWIDCEAHHELLLRGIQQKINMK